LVGHWGIERVFGRRNNARSGVCRATTESYREKVKYCTEQLHAQTSNVMLLLWWMDDFLPALRADSNNIVVNL
jgi:hypothetical protein